MDTFPLIKSHHSSDRSDHRQADLVAQHNWAISYGCSEISWGGFRSRCASFSTTNSEGSAMVELGGIRYAVGVPTAATMCMSAAAMTATYLCAIGVDIADMSVGFALAAHPLVMDLASGGLLAGWFGLLVVALMLSLADKQPRADGPRAWARGVWALQVSPLMTSRPFLLLVGLLVLMIMQHITCGLASFVFSQLGSLVMLVQAWICLRLARGMWRDARVRDVTGRRDKCRDFNWTRFQGQAEQRLPRDNGNTRWKLARLMHHHAEAQRYARRARSVQGFAVVVGGMAAVLLAFLVSQPAGVRIRVLAEAMVHKGPAVAIGVLDVYVGFGLFALLLVPLAMQQVAARMGELAREYDDRARQLRKVDAVPWVPLRRLAARPTAGRRPAGWRVAGRGRGVT